MILTHGSNSVSGIKLGDNKISSVLIDSSRKGFVTPNFNIEDATLIEENIVTKASNWAPGANFTMTGGQWYSGTSTKFVGIAVYLWANQIEFDYGDNVSSHYDFVPGIPYDFNTIVRKNIIYDKTTGIATCKIYYDDSLVCTYTKNISELYLSGNRGYCLLGNREGDLVDNGYIDINNSYIRIDGDIVWGVYGH